MMPLFSAMAGPLLRARGIPLVTWFAHPTLSTLLKVAHGFSNRMVSSVASAYPYKHNKLTVIGQGIDTEIFSPDFTVREETPALIACAGRLSPVKDHGTLIKAAALLRELTDLPFRVALVGAAGSPRDHAHIKSLRQQVCDLRLEEIVRFESAVPITKLASWYRRSTVHVNLTPRGFGDKVAWEAMSCATPCLVANDGFRETLGQYADDLLFAYGNARHLAERLHWILSLAEAQRGNMGNYLRDQVVRLHSLDRLTGNLLQVFADLKSRSSGLLPSGAQAKQA
jgi:glycosyltransferase involved in cell wall biosynthesis